MYEFMETFATFWNIIFTIILFIFVIWALAYFLYGSYTCAKIYPNKLINVYNIIILSTIIIILVLYFLLFFMSDYYDIIYPLFFIFSLLLCIFLSLMFYEAENVSYLTVDFLKPITYLAFLILIINILVLILIF